jgi:hypothetical protein
MRTLPCALAVLGAITAVVIAVRSADGSSSNATSTAKPAPAGELLLPAAAPALPAARAASAPADAVAVAPARAVAGPQPYLQGHTPVAILDDGTQIFDGIPYRVRRPDGTMAALECRITLKPTRPAPVFAVEAAAGTGAR